MELTVAGTPDMRASGADAARPAAGGVGDQRARAQASELEIRASDAERAQVRAQLKQASVEGRLTLEEFGERVTQVLAARTRGDLAVITRDLPPGTPLAARSAPPLATVGTAGTIRLPGARRTVTSTTAVLSGVERTG